MILITYSPFTAESQVYIIENDTIKTKVYSPSTIEGLTDSILALSQANNVYEVKVQAPMHFIGEIKRSVEQKETALYSENKITVEGI